MIIFTVTNQVTGQIYVGSTRNDLECQWEKMVAAADQNMEYPLYKEIRSQGAENFQVEEWDCTDDRAELAMLEQEAIETFNAKSLKGYKTSTVKIQPKKKVRQRKSSIEKELVSLFAELAEENSSDDTPVPSGIALPAEKESNKDAEKRSIAPVSEKTTSPQRAAASIAAARVSEKPSTPEPVKEKVKPEQPVGGSQANAIVHMNNINLSDDITAQLAAIQAAADAAIAGDTSAATELCAAPEVKKETSSIEDTPVNETVKLEPVKEVEIEVKLDPKELKIRDAIERHRKARAQKSSDTLAAEKQKIANLLADLEARAAALQTVSLAAAA